MKAFSYITSLPHDVLYAICFDVCTAKLSNGMETKNFETFQLVCSLFRKTALSIPHLWSCVNDQMDIDRMTLQLERCGSNIGMSFKIRLEDYPPPPCMCHRWELIKMNKMRWTSGEITLDHDFEDGHECVDMLIGLDLPFVTSMTLELHRFDGIDLALHWSIPKLEELVCRSSTWETSLISFEEDSFPNLQRLTVVNENPEIDSMSTAQLLEMLAMPAIMGQVRELTLDFSSWGAFQSMDLRGDSEISCVRLPHVETLRVDIAQQFDDTIECEFLHHVETPNVRHVWVKIDKYSDVSEWLSDLVNPHLEKVEVVCVLRKGTDTNAIRDKIFEWFGIAAEEVGDEVGVDSQMVYTNGTLGRSDKPEVVVTLVKRR